MSIMLNNKMNKKLSTTAGNKKPVVKNIESKTLSLSQKRKKLFRILSLSASLVAVGGSTGAIFGIGSYFSGQKNYITIIPYKKDANCTSYGGSTGISTKTEWLLNEQYDEPTTEGAKGAEVFKNLKGDFDVATAHPSNSGNGIESYSTTIIDSPDSECMDLSFNESTYQGLVNWTRRNVENKPEGKTKWEPGKVPTVKLNDLVSPDTTPVDFENKNQGTYVRPFSSDSTGYINAYKTAYDKHSGKLHNEILSGFLHITPLLTYITQEQVIKNLGFTLIDATVANQQVSSVQFRSDQGAFLSGLSTCQFLQDNYEQVYSKINDGQLAVGTFGGIEIPSVTSYMGGFQLGVWTYNNYVLPYLTDYEKWTQAEKELRTVKFIDNGVEESYFSQSFSIGDGKQITRQLLSQGADAILPVAGPQTSDVVSEINDEHSAAICIGVDTAQEDGQLRTKSSSPLWKEVNPDQKIIFHSVIKDMAYIISMILDASAQGIRGWKVTDAGAVERVTFDGTTKIEANDIGTYGYVTVGSLTNKGTGISDAGKNALIEAVSTIARHFTSGTNIENYNDAVTYLLTTKLINKETVTTEDPDKTLIDMVNDNLYFRW